MQAPSCISNSMSGASTPTGKPAQGPLVPLDLLRPLPAGLRVSPWFEFPDASSADPDQLARRTETAPQVLVHSRGPSIIRNTSARPAWALLYRLFGAAGREAAAPRGPACARWIGVSPRTRSSSSRIRLAQAQAAVQEGAGAPAGDAGKSCREGGGAREQGGAQGKGAREDRRERGDEGSRGRLYQVG